MGQVQVFDVNRYLNQHAVNIKTVVQVHDSKGPDINSYDDVWRQVRKHFELLYDSNKVPQKDKEKRLELEYQAMIGNYKAERYITDEIESFLREENLLGTPYPEFYDSLSEACFHEIYGFSNFAKWNKYSQSTDGVIQGKEIWFNIQGEWVRQKESLRDENHDWEIIRQLQLKSRGLRINENNPQAELDRGDGTRIKILVPPRVYQPTVIFRRFTVKKFSFEKQAENQTIPKEDIPFYIALSKLQLNTVIAGEVQSGKSTMLKTIYAERDPKLVSVLIEDTPESFLKKDFPDRLVHDCYSTGGNIHHVIRDVLRIPHDFIIAQEVRGIEAEGAISGTERGTRGLLMTYHITNPKNVPMQLARHILDEFPNRTERSETRRIAEQLDIGITMTKLKNNEKRITSVYEIVYDDDKDEAWIQYLIRYDKKTDSWVYNSKVSPFLLNRMNEIDEELTSEFLQLLKKREEIYPMKIDPVVKCF